MEAAYRKAIEYDPDITEAYNRLSNILREQGKYAEAEEAYRKLVALDPGFFEACATSVAFCLLSRSTVRR